MNPFQAVCQQLYSVTGSYVVALILGLLLLIGAPILIGCAYVAYHEKRAGVPRPNYQTKGEYHE